MTLSRSLLFLTLLTAVSLLAEESSSMRVNIEPILRSEDGSSATALVVLRNYTGRQVTDVDLDLVLTSSNPVTFTAADHPGWPPQWSCANVGENVGAQHVRCRLPLFASTVAGAFVPLVAAYTPAGEGRFSITAQATWKLDSATFTSPVFTLTSLLERPIVITNTRDAGPGSFRAAIEEANDACARENVPCVFGFQFDEPLPAQGWYTIRPLTPLPAITAPDLAINYPSNKPRLELDGSLLATGHGLELRGEGLSLSIAYLTIGGFPWDGVAITRKGGTVIFASTIGVRPNGQPNPNGSRGLTIDPPASDVRLSSVRASGNVRSGFFIAGGERILLEGCFLGRLGYENPLLGNGASGLFAGPAARDVFIHRTFIGGNAHMGIAVARGARGVRVDDTWIDPNSGLPIDHGLDEFSGYVRRDGDFALPAPRITSAVYDQAANTTTFRGTFEAPDPTANWKLTLYSGSMGIWPAVSLPTTVFTGTAFTMTLRGHPNVVRATVSSAQPSDFSTSEFSEPFTVSASGNKLLSTVLRRR
jgi:hypothetical protein